MGPRVSVFQVFWCSRCSRCFSYKTRWVISYLFQLNVTTAIYYWVTYHSSVGSSCSIRSSHPAVQPSHSNQPSRSNQLSHSNQPSHSTQPSHSNQPYHSFHPQNI